ncbi:MAG TPA: iron-containing redox enzyme family protein [Polyangium sp.]|nr:iron-containing redox enzyme family protein [Polyangium sp.]
MGPKAEEESPIVQDSDITWARIAEGKIVVATSARAFLHEEERAFGGPFSVPPEGPASLAATRNLLDGALGVAQREGAAPPRRELTLAGWIHRLAGYFHTTHATPRLMIEAAARFEAEGRAALAAWAHEKSRDEHGHDALALRDLASLGYDARALVAAHVPETAAALVDFFTSLVRAPGDPARCVGYAFALERLAATRSAAEVRAVQAVLPSGVDATRCLRVHSAAGTDADHVDDIVTLASGLAHGEREAIARAAYETTRIGRIARGSVARSDDDLSVMFEPFRVKLGA